MFSNSLCRWDTSSRFWLNGLDLFFQKNIPISLHFVIVTQKVIYLCVHCTLYIVHCTLFMFMFKEFTKNV